MGRGLSRILLRTFGGVEVRAAGQRIQAVQTQPKRLALLLYLAADRPGRLQPREHLLGLFWPDSTADRARASLRQGLSFLRSALGEDAIISSGRAEVGIDPEVVWCDYARFDQCLRTGDLAEALDLYQGDFARSLFVPGSNSFERWLDEKRHRSERAAGDAAWRLAGVEEAQGNRLAAAHWAREAVSLLPLDESKAREAIRLLDRIGDVAGALDQYRRLCRRFELELGTSPSAETQDLIAEIRSRMKEIEPSGTTDNRPADVVRTQVPAPTELQELEEELGPDIRIERVLRETPLGLEYLVRDLPVKRLLCAKVLSRDLAKSPEARGRFQRESLASARISHEAVPALYRVGRTATDLPYALRPHIAGTNLRDRLSGIGSLPPKTVRKIASPVAHALAAAHARGVIHRDVRLANVVVENDTERVFLVDFGLARILESEDEELVKLTRTGLVLGDPEYVSPEQLRGDPVSDRTDVYSLGVLIWRLLVGPAARREFVEGQDHTASELRPDGDPDLGEIVRRCLTPAPEARPDARTVAHWLDRTAKIPARGSLLQQLRSYLSPRERPGPSTST